MGSEGKMKRMSSGVVTCLALLLSCLFMISSCDARVITIQQVTQRQSSDHESQQYQLTESEGSNQLTTVVDEPQASYADLTRLGITQTLRNQTPSSYLLRIEGFSELLSKPPSYESAAFDASGYQWRLIFYPNETDYISLYVRIETLPYNSSLDVDLKLFVYNQLQKKYLTVQDGEVKSFDENKTQWGFPLLSLSEFMNSSNGYLVNDTCLLGAEIFIIRPSKKIETLSWIHNPKNGKRSWIADLTKTEPDGRITSAVTRVGDRNWGLVIFPNGTDEYVGKYLSVFLVAWDFPPGTAVAPTYAWVGVRLQKQIGYLLSEDYEKHTGGWYSINPSTFPDLENFISLKDLYNKSNHYVVDNKIILQYDFDIVSVTTVENFPIPQKKLGSFEAVPTLM